MRPVIIPRPCPSYNPRSCFHSNLSASSTYRALPRAVEMKGAKSAVVVYLDAEGNEVTVRLPKLDGARLFYSSSPPHSSSSFSSSSSPHSSSSSTHSSSSSSSSSPHPPCSTAGCGDPVITKRPFILTHASFYEARMLNHSKVPQLFFKDSWLK